MLSDAHIHLSAFAEDYLAAHPMPTVVSCATPEEAARAFALAEKLPDLFPSCGIHPWQVDTADWDAMLPWLDRAAIIGEIGMDNVWCQTDLGLQAEFFERQLAYAQAQHKPVVLHTKGMEREILERIRRYPNTYHVHWYAEESLIDDYLALGCYMSVGPFPSLDPAVAAVAARTPDERLLIETDGIDAVAWATGKSVAPDDYPRALAQIARETAALRDTTEDHILTLAHDNLLRFAKTAATSER
ncbi:MAG: TatD family hydrolase [Peptococcaceae bacterium]|nr:TatD family hydrolase [Peptococcaceae bacterium]